MATYRQIQNRVRAQAGYVPKSSWIADVKEAHALTRRLAHNRQSEERRINPCPPEKRASIEAAMQYFGMLNAERAEA